MQIEIEITTIVTLYAAVISTFAVGWHIYTYLRSGVRLGIDLTSNMQFLSNKQFGEEKFINMTIRNVGGQPTTIQNAVIFGFKNKLSYIRNKNSLSAVVHDQYAPSLPHLLESGTTWATQIRQTQVEDIIEKKALKFIAIGVYDSSSKKPKLKRLNIKTLSNIENA